MKTLKYWVLTQTLPYGIELLVEHQHKLLIRVLEPSLFRITLKAKGDYQFDRTWSIAPEQDTPWEGRQRDDLSGFSCPPFNVEQSPDQLVIATETLRVIVSQPLHLRWEIKTNAGQWQLLTEERRTGSYLLNGQGEGVAHYLSRQTGERYYGLGEKSGDLQRNGRRFEMRNLDAMGYDAQHTDPLYKHIPFVITHQPHASFGLFYDNLAHCWFDLGNELDNYHRPYRRWQAECGDLDFYLFSGAQIVDVTKTFVRLTGKTCFGPKWSLGYSGSTMSYTDAPDAQHQLQKFIALCQQHDIPCDSFQLSSGYTSIANKRYVFNWNYDKVPDPQALTSTFHQAGIKLAANIKPCLLQDHPKYQQVAKQQLFIRDSQTGQPERSVFWDDEGSHLDFTNPDTVAWWQDNVTEQLLKNGIDSTWNDNNEYEIWDGEAECFGFGKPIAIKYIRPVMPLLMMRASLTAQQTFSPKKRPYLISRSGCAGMQRYVQTWSGDNRTNWNTLRYNIRMGLGMSLSGLYNVGHDVGGFSGDKPESELFVRWVQNGVMHPRFTIHSWNDDHSVNEPWMYPQVTSIIRQAIALRYQLMPYLYTLLWLAHQDDEPMLRPTFLDHPHDEQTYVENDDFMLGKSLLVASVVEPGQRERQVWLPVNESGWCDFYTGQWYAPGQWVTLAAPLEHIPLLVKAGDAIPLSQIRHADSMDKDTVRQLKLYPSPGCYKSQGLIFEDDGESWDYQQGKALWIEWQLVSDNQSLHLTLTASGKFAPSWTTMTVILPTDETRDLLINGSQINEWCRA